jgi:2',3'-cyclic-nucleotide 2'-phosphodiesterase (5'-nucleotidase family)
MGRLAAFAQAVRREHPYTVFVDAGDDHEKGSVAEELSRGASTAEIVKAMHFDVRVLGNHDFGWGAAHLLEFSRDPTALLLSSNVRYRGTVPEDFGGVDYGEIDVECLRIGFIGMVTRPWGANDREFTADYFPEFDCRFDYVRRARELVSEHRSRVDLLVMVNHLGIGQDARIASAVEGIDVALGGHSHTTMRKPKTSGTSIIAHAGSHGRHVARLELEFDLSTRAWTGYRYELVKNVPGLLPSDPALDRRIAGLVRASAPDAERPLFRLGRAANRAQMAEFAARAAVDVLGVTAAFVDPTRVKSTWASGAVSQQRLLDAFPIQHHPPGTPGDTSMYLARLSRHDVFRIRRHRPRWAYAEAPAAGQRNRNTVALQKHMALHPKEYLPDGVHPAQPRLGDELWRLVQAYSRRAATERQWVGLGSASSALLGLLPPAAATRSDAGPLLVLPQ